MRVKCVNTLINFDFQMPVRMHQRSHARLNRKNSEKTKQTVSVNSQNLRKCELTIDLLTEVLYKLVAGRGSRVAGSKSRVAGFKKVAGFEKVAGFAKSRLFLKSCEFSIECIYFSVKFIQTNLNRMPVSYIFCQRSTSFT